jgi:hypothetical protein
VVTIITPGKLRPVSSTPALAGSPRMAGVSPPLRTWGTGSNFTGNPTPSESDSRKWSSLQGVHLLDGEYYPCPSDRDRDPDAITVDSAPNRALQSTPRASFLKEVSPLHENTNQAGGDEGDGPEKIEVDPGLA